MKIELPTIKVHYFPSNPRGHQIIKETPLEAWKELIFCLHRFGHHVNLGPKKGERIELQNIKVVVEIADLDHLTKLLHHLQQLDGIIEAKRI